MKKMFIILLICFTGYSALSQNLKSEASTHFDNSTKNLKKDLNRKFQDNGNKLLNVNGSLPKHFLSIMTVNKENVKMSSKPEELLIVNTLLFTGKLSDYISEPFWLAPGFSKKTPDKN